MEHRYFPFTSLFPGQNANPGSQVDFESHHPFFRHCFLPNTIESSIESNLLLNLQSLFGRDGAEVAHSHEGGGVPQVNLQGPRVAGLPKALDSIRVPEEMGVHPLAYSGSFGSFLDDLPGALTVDLKDPVIEVQLFVEGVALEAMGQVPGTGHRSGLACLALDMKGSPLFRDVDSAGSKAKGLGDAHPGLEEGEDEELIPEAIPPLAGSRQAGYFLPGEIRDGAQSIG